MTLTKKLAFIIISIVYAISLAISYVFFNFEDARYVLWLITALMVGVSNFLLIRVYGYDNYLKSKLVFITLVLFFGYLLLAFFPTLGYYSRTAYTLLSSFGIYLLMLGVNVYIVSERREDTIPLLQPAKVVTYLAFVVLVFIASTVIYKLGFFNDSPVFNLLLKSIGFIIFYYFLFRYTSWIFISEGRVGGEAFDEGNHRVLKRLQIFSLICMSQFSIALMFFPFEAFGRAVILGGVAYYATNFIQNYIAHKINLRFLFEIIIAITAIYTLVYFI